MAKRFKWSVDKFTGLNLSSDKEFSLKTGESPEMVNFTVTDAYKLKKREGFSVLSRHNSEGRGIFSGVVGERECVVYVAGKSVYSYCDGEEALIGEMESEAGQVSFLLLSKKLYLLDGVKIKTWNGSVFSSIQPYRPLVAVSTTPDGAGVSFEEKNILTGKMRQSFSPGANSVTLHLAVGELDSVDYVHIGGRKLATTNYTFDLKKGTVTFSSSAEEMLLPDGVEVGFTKNSGNETLINRMKHALLYGGANDTRVFLYGDEENPNTIYYSGTSMGISSMEYFPENNFNIVGARGRITSLVRHFDRLMIFCQGESFYSYMEESESESGVKYSVFPAFPLSDSVGCDTDGFAVLIDNYPVTLDRFNLYRWHSSSVRDERYAEAFGTRIREALLNWDVRKARSFDCEVRRELFVWCGDECYVYNYALDVFYLWRGLRASGFCVSDGGRIYLLRDDGTLCALFEKALDDTVPVNAVWTTPYLDYTDGVKNLYRLDVEVFPDVDTRLDLFWTSDHAESGERSFCEEYRRFSFKPLDFTRLGFKTGIAPARLSARIKHKRFRKMKLRFENDSDSSLHISSYSVEGSVTDKK